MKKCPYCFEEIQSKAIKCKHCGEMLNVSKKPTIKYSDTNNDNKNLNILEKYGKISLYIIGVSLMSSGLSEFGKGDTSTIFNIVSGLSIILACQSHTGLVSRLNGTVRKVKEFLPLFLLVLLILFTFSFIPKNILVENPMIIFPGLFYIGLYIYKVYIVKKN